MQTNRRLRTALLLALVPIAVVITGCEVPAANGTVEVLIRGLGTTDLDSQGRRLGAIAGLSADQCAEGPCSPNPCVGDPEGKERCVGMGELHMCACPAGTHADDTGVCVDDDACLPTTCSQRGMCAQEADALTCTCNEGVAGDRCELCDEAAGFYPDGLGGCSQSLNACRVGDGIDEFRAIVAEAEEELGRAPTEIELTGVRIEAVDGTQRGVRSWYYLWPRDITVFFQTTSGLIPRNAGRIDAPAEADGLDPLELDVLLDRPTMTRDSQFLEGQFRVGISGESDRLLTDNFGTDIKIILDFAAY